METDPFWDIKYPERTEWQFGVGIKREGKIQYEFWVIPINKTDRQHLHPGSVRYGVISTLALSRHRCGVTLFYRNSLAFAVEVIHQFGANVIECQLATGDRRWYIVGCYLVPGDGATIWDMEVAMAELQSGTDLIVAGDLNVDVRRTGRKGRGEEIAATVEMAGLEYILAHFLP